MTERRKHADLIIAWAEGAEIQFKNPDGIWKTIKRPGWHEDSEYRLAPQAPKANLTDEEIYNTLGSGTPQVTVNRARRVADLALKRYWESQGGGK